MPIEKIKARQIFDSRGLPTLEVDLITDIGIFRSSVSAPSLNPNDKSDSRDNSHVEIHRQSVFKAVEDINTIISSELLKSRLDVCQQREIDLLMLKLDDTDDKSKLGINAILGVSIACCKAGAVKKGIPLYKYIGLLSNNSEFIVPVPIFNVINGGKRAGNPLTCQEFMIIPIGAKTFREAMTMGIDVFHSLESIIAESEELKLPLNVSDEGGFSPEYEENSEALSAIAEAIKVSGYEGKVKIAIDMAATTFYREGLYDLEYKTEDTDPDDYLEAEALRDQYLELLTEFPQLVLIKDPFDQEDWDGWQMLMDQPIQIVADDLTAMNIERIEEAIEKGAANSLAIKLSQIGTISEAIDCYKMARDNYWATIICADIGETEDNFIADFAVGLSAGQFKAGAPCRGERIAKYNQILRLEEELGSDTKYAGEMYRNPWKLAENFTNEENDKVVKKKKKMKKRL